MFTMIALAVLAAAVGFLFFTKSGKADVALLEVSIANLWKLKAPTPAPSPPAVPAQPMPAAQAAPGPGVAGQGV